ncbi:MAG TPA: Hsp20/alpha crystallin family protein [Longimicrobiales bacterium]|nr:Hsp20/alpha crystallin family protein [Longimicrobiales bacterium]
MVRVPMTRRPRSPFPDLGGFQRDLDTLFGGPWRSALEDLWTPAVDVEETPDELVLRAELPGMDREDIQVELEDGVLTIQGEKKEERDEENAQGLLYERRWGTFTRRFTLPRAVNPDRVSADYHNGLLTVRVPKAEEAKGRKIQIGDGSGASGRDVTEH